jgi:hypothetical protein
VFPVRLADYLWSGGESRGIGHASMVIPRPAIVSSSEFLPPR